MKKIFVLLIALMSLFSTVTFAHSGGTDANGCHAGKKPYHCHNPK